MHHKQIIIRAAIAVAWSGFCLHTYVSDTSTVSSSSLTLDDGELNLRRQLSRNKDKRQPVPDDKESISIDADGTDSLLLTIPPMAAGKEQDAANEPNNVDPDAWTDAAKKYYDTVDSMIKNGEEEEEDKEVTTVSIYLAVGAAVSRGRGNKLIPQLSHSFLNTGMIERFGTGRVKYDIYPTAPFTKDCTNSTNKSGVHQKKQRKVSEPCLAASHVLTASLEDLQCSYPQCKSMIVADEFCSVKGADVRHYQSDNLEGLFLPLGPRYDSWESFKKIQQEPTFVSLPSSERRYAFNAIFSLSTASRGRRPLSRIIEGLERTISRREDRNKKHMNIFSRISKRYTWKPNDTKSEQLDTDQYVQVLYDSTFTLTPAGHNPECYRIYEAIEAGSIPILVHDDLYITDEKQHVCVGALVHLYDAPLVVLESWNELSSTVEGLLKDTVELNAMQDRLTLWYETYMKKVVADFEDLMIGSSTVDVEKEGLETSVA